mmetsp:Transcript_10421/g.31298  ORF Transcript_10421/g.31298 Transcript_10421/m.31298 type:complete len:322 (-) Transcript_10421:288-1253(-)
MALLLGGDHRLLYEGQVRVGDDEVRLHAAAVVELHARGRPALHADLLDACAEVELDAELLAAAPQCLGDLVEAADGVVHAVAQLDGREQAEHRRRVVRREAHVEVLEAEQRIQLLGLEVLLEVLVVRQQREVPRRQRVRDEFGQHIQRQLLLDEVRPAALEVDLGALHVLLVLLVGSRLDGLEVPLEVRVARVQHEARAVVEVRLVRRVHARDCHLLVEVQAAGREGLAVDIREQQQARAKLEAAALDDRLVDAPADLVLRVLLEDLDLVAVLSEQRRAHEAPHARAHDGHGLAAAALRRARRRRRRRRPRHVHVGGFQRA